MVRKIPEQLLEAFAEAAGDRTGDAAGWTGVDVDRETADAPVSGSAPQAMPAGVYRESANPVGSSVKSGPVASSGGDGGSTAGDIAATFFESGFGMAALVKGLVGLFGGGSPEPAPLERYQMPAAIDFESAETSGGLAAAGYDQLGRPRAIAPQPDGGGRAAAAPQITVNVQAMDARSFLDHSGEIAEAVRGAMLNLSAINDVVNEL